MGSSRICVAFLLVACGSVNKITPDAPPESADASFDAAPTCMPSCDDMDPCTTDTCPSSSCVHTPKCDDGNPNSVDTCQPTTGACSHVATFTYTGGMQSLLVPAQVTMLHVVALGAQGGSSNGQPGGLGASMAGDFTVTPGHTISILVGGAGIDGSTTDASERGGTGGGGSFVVDGATILVIAGGGGGAIAGFTFGTGPGGPGQTTTAGQTGSPAGFAGGTNGGGGTSSNNTAYHGGTGGGGYSGDGIGNSMGASTYGTPDTPGLAYIHGGAGGTGGTQGRNGGFGGGGSGGYCGAGGGGYSGGGAGTNIVAGATAPYNGGGGGSINNGTNQVNTAGARTGNGQITISW